MAKREKQTITTKDIGVLEMGKDGKITVYSKKKCDICGEEYSMYNSEKPRLNKRRKPARLPNEWTEDEVIAHRIGHIKSSKSRRIAGSIIKLNDKDRKEVIDFVNE